MSLYYREVDSKGYQQGIGKHVREKVGSYMAIDILGEASILGSENGHRDIRVGGGD